MVQLGVYFDVVKCKFLFDVVMVVCDCFDGVVDGVISNVDICNVCFDLVMVLFNGKFLCCEGGGEGGDGCLLDVQIVVFKVFSMLLELFYLLVSGEMCYFGFNIWGMDWGMGMGSFFQVIIQILGLGIEQFVNFMLGVSSKGSLLYYSIFWDQWVCYFVMCDVNFNLLVLDLLWLGGYQVWVVVLNGLQDVNQIDFLVFCNKGGKILIVYGMVDVLVSMQVMWQYLGCLQKVMGEQQFEGFVCYYEIFGYGYVFGIVFNVFWDLLIVLE